MSGDDLSVLLPAEKYNAAFGRRDYIGAIIALRELGSDRLAPGLDPPVDEEAVASVIGAETTADALCNLASALWQSDSGENVAAEIMEQAAERGSGRARISVGEMWAWLGQPERAAPWLRIALDEMEANDETFDRRAWLEGLLGEVLLETEPSGEEAATCLERAVSVHAEFAVAYARALRRLGRSDEARRNLEELIERGVYGAAIQLGNLLDEDYDDAEGAIRAYEEGIRSQDGHSAYNLGLLLHRLDRGDEARRSFAEARTLGDTTLPPLELDEVDRS